MCQFYCLLITIKKKLNLKLKKKKIIIMRIYIYWPLFVQYQYSILRYAYRESVNEERQLLELFLLYLVGLLCTDVSRACSSLLSPLHVQRFSDAKSRD